MGERQQKGLSPRQRKSIVIRGVLLLLCVIILYGEYIAEFDGIYPRLLNNTVIRKADSSYLACGENVGTEEKIVHGAEADYPVICTYEFLPCE